MRKTHKQKVREARQMITRREILAGTPLFTSRNWLIRKYATMLRIHKEQKAAAKRKGYVEPPKKPVETVAYAQQPAKVEQPKKRSWLKKVLS